jgi:isopentenyldiphosphate isomerase
MSSHTGKPAGQVQQNDPSELLEVFDARGRPTGRAHTRAAIHLDGDWHQAFHCWILRAGRGGREIVLQRRSPRKDTFASRWDAAAAGHWRFGESAEEAAREINEELGLDVPFSALRWVGRERLARHFPNGLIDREYHQVYAFAYDAPLATYRPDPNEVSALAAVPAHELIELVLGRRERLEATEAVRVEPSGALVPEPIELRRADLVPYSAARLRRLLRGNTRRPGRVLWSAKSHH